MKNLNLVLVVLLFLSSCGKVQEKDITKVNNLLMVTDSILERIQFIYTSTSEDLYSIPEDSILVDSLIRILDLPDSLGFYQYLQQSIVDVEEMISETRQEVYFFNDQVSSLKNEYLENKIDQSEYEEELEELETVLDFLITRVDSNMIFIQEEYSPFFSEVTDSIVE